MEKGAEKNLELEVQAWEKMVDSSWVFYVLSWGNACGGHVI
jgi:hypothetical protein